MKKMKSFEEAKVADLTEIDDWSSAWEECKKLGLKWGGRGRGGRAAGRMTTQTKDVVLEGCTLSYSGKTLLDRTTLRLLNGKRYGLVGNNGVGKSTLMARIDSCTLPGFPTHLRVSKVAQELPDLSIFDPLITPVEFVIETDPERKNVLKQISLLEERADMDKTDSEEEVLANTNLLLDLYEQLEDEGKLRKRVVRLLKSLGFSDAQCKQNLASMSGGWVMRAAIASAIAQEPQILLLDEPTNNLDAEGIEWLKSYFLSPAASEVTVLVTSHDRFFLDDVCTDTIIFKNRQLKYYEGNYSAYEDAYRNKELHLSRVQEGIDKKRSHVEESIRKLQINAHRSTSEAGFGAIASLKKKLTRHGAEKNEKGFRFRVQRDSYNGMSATRAGSMTGEALGRKTHESRGLTDNPDLHQSFFIPSGASLLTFGPYVQLKDTSVGYLKEVYLDGILKTSELTTILTGVTLDLEANSKIGLVSSNGSGKTTLMRLISEFESDVVEDSPSDDGKGKLKIISGSVWKARNLKVAYYEQNIDALLPNELSPLQYLQEYCKEGDFKTTLSTYTEQMLRGHLGSFGIGGDLALIPIGYLSGGQKTRVTLARLTLIHPNLLLLDEPTHNLDMDGIQALSEALVAFDGAFIISSHDMSFVENTCSVVYQIKKKSLKLLEDGVSQYIAEIRERVEKKLMADK